MSQRESVRKSNIAATTSSIPTLKLILSTNPVLAQSSRLSEIDFFRGAAILLMISFHVMFYLKQFGIDSVANEIELSRLFWDWYPNLSSTLFLILVGVSAVLKVKHRKLSFRSFHKRTVHILCYSALVTAATAIVTPRYTVYFGVLHCIGASLIVVTPFLRFAYFSLVLGTLLLVTGEFIRGISVSTAWFIWAGLVPPKFSMGDYFPLIPFSGLVFIGVFIGQLAYVKRSFSLDDHPRLKTIVTSRPGACLQYLGKHSLLIYLAHHPLLIGAFYCFGLIRF